MRRVRAQAALLGLLGLAFPIAAALVAVGANRAWVANALAVVFTACIYLALSTVWWPGSLPRLSSRAARLDAVCKLWFGISFTIHLTWELGFLLFHEAIIRAPEAAWSYAWWAYIDGGDLRYADPGPELLTMEVLSVINGSLGFVCLFAWERARRAGRSIALWAQLGLMATAVVHLYSTSLYYGGEALGGFPNVDTDSVGSFWGKFVGSNSPWVVMPWVVLAWGYGGLRRRLGAPAEPARQ